MVDVVTAGFPCQPFSVAGKRLGEDDERNMWPQTFRVISIIRPQYCLLENVARLATDPYMGTIIKDLEEIGYSIPWPKIIASKDVGAPHERKRVFLIPFTHGERRIGLEKEQEVRYSDLHSQMPFQWEDGSPYIPIPMVLPFDSPLRGVRRMDDGLAEGMDRLKAIGNGQDARVVKAAWRLMGPQ